jgi:hypothetical protein
MAVSYAGPGITRLDLEDTHNHGFMVRLFREGKRYSAYFADSKCGGKRNAKKMAQEWYQEMLAKLGPANNKGCLDRLTERNTTGIVGVHIAVSTDTRWAGGTYKAYCSSWVLESGKRQKIAFSWKRYGKAKALEYAIYARKHRLTDRTAIVKAVDSRLKRKAGSKATKSTAPKKRK